MDTCLSEIWRVVKPVVIGNFCNIIQNSVRKKLTISTAVLTVHDVIEPTMTFISY